MPWPNRSVPKFGNWDRDGDVSYSNVFDKARTEKEAPFQILDERFEKDFSSRSLSPKSDGRTGSKASQSLPSVSGRGGKERFSQTLEGNGSFATSHQRGSSEHRAGKGRFHDTNHESTCPTFLSWQAGVLRGHQNVGCEQCLRNLQACPQKFSGLCAHNPIVSGVPSKQPTATTERHRSDQDDRVLDGTRHSKSLGSGRHLYDEKLRDAKPGNPSGGNFEMQRGTTVPKFGDWENGDGYTEVFDNMRKERNSKHASRRSILRGGQVEMEHDPYKGSEQIKHQRSWLPNMCCTKPYPKAY